MGPKPQSERLVAEALRAQLGDADVLLEGVRFSDPHFGDIEIDIILLLAGHGVAVLEVKGGEVSFRDGEWFLKFRDYQRRINPVEQARRAKHALRRYLDRQPSWQHGLVRAQWFLAMPYTQVTGDFGPEGRRELLIGSNDLGNIMERIKTELAASADQGAVPDAAAVSEIYALLHNSEAASRNAESTRKHLGFAAAAAIVSGGFSYFGGLNGNTAAFVAAGFAVAAGIHWWGERRNLIPHPRKRHRVATAVAAIVASALALVVGKSFFAFGLDKNCDPNYSSCVPIKQDVDCVDIGGDGGEIQVLGKDIYGLDRDGDGRACEWNNN